MPTNQPQNPIDTLVSLSQKYGGDPRFCIAGGGNTSAKVEGTLHVKASGVALATIDSTGFVSMDRAALDTLIAADLGDDPDIREAKFKAAVMAARHEPERGQRPSVECVLHNLMPGQFVVHSHSTIVNMLTCSTTGEALAQEIFGDEIVWLPYTTPGFVLAKALDDALTKFYAGGPKRSPLAVIMGNHGLIIDGDTAEEIDKKTADVVARVRACVGEISETPFGEITEVGEKAPIIRRIAPALRGLLTEDTALKIVTFDDSPDARSLACGANGDDTVEGGPLSPDQIVYCKSFPLWFELNPEEDEAAERERLSKAITAYRNKNQFLPHVVIVRGVGIFSAGDTPKAANIVREVYDDAIKIMAGANALGGVQYMTTPDREFIEHWEVEAYRRKEAAKGRVAGRADGKIALVTGAARGFGREIAEDLAAQGANVILADVNAEGVRAAADEIGGSAIGVAMNVTDAASVDAALDETLRAFGGVDLFVSNAGVVKSESVKTQSEEDFAFVTDVNYKGFFICTKHAAPIMARQRGGNTDRWFDIVQINSKSGLEGSNKNAAYAGSKFGGIGLVQSFALELVADGIKVNAICPGNFLDGPLWSDPETGLFKQYLDAGKVPGAKTVADVRAAYEGKVPMNRGCTTADVMKAIYYTLEQHYETGQAIPVTGGQVMLS